MLGETSPWQREAGRGGEAVPRRKDKRDLGCFVQRKKRGSVGSARKRDTPCMKNTCVTGKNVKSKHDTGSDAFDGVW